MAENDDKPTADPPAEPLRHVQMVYAGLRYWDHLGGKGKQSTLWYILDDSGEADEGERDRRCTFGANTGRKGSILTGAGAVPGMVYDVVEVKAGSYRADDAVRPVKFHDAEARERWRLESRADQTRLEAEKELDKDGFGAMTLDQLKATYRKRVGSGRRAALLAALVQHVTG